MFRLLPACLALFACTPTAGLADDLVQSRHSTVHIIFIASHSQQSQFLGTGMGAAQSPMMHVGNTIGPADGIRLIRITIDGDFVGHAMVGMFDVKPVFVLPEGKHKLTFAIDGFDPVTADLKVLGTNSTQYLVVKLPSEKPESKRSAVSNDATSVRQSDN
jgi:hypothetical protein